MNPSYSTVAILLLSLPIAAIAQPDNGDIELSLADSMILEEVVVTARKREENLQDIAATVTALSGDELAVAGIGDLVALETRVPGFSMGTFNLGQPQLFIRGIGSNEDGAGGDNSVVVFVDEVYIGRSAGSFLYLNDLEQVEVLRGPQGTLWGKNVVGGAISLITKKPTDTFHSSGRVGLGNYAKQLLQGMVRGPLTESLQGLASFGLERRDGYMTSAVDGLQLNDKDAMNGRLALRTFILDDLEVNWSADVTRDRQAGPGRIVTHGSVAAVFDQSNDELTFADDLGKQDRDVYGSSVRLDYDFTWAGLTSITAYRHSSFDLLDDSFAINVAVYPQDFLNGVAEDADQYSQELRLVSTDDDSVFNWIGGVYLLREDIHREEFFTVFLSPAAFGLSCPYRCDIGTAVTLQKNTTTSAALFGEVGYDFDEQWAVSVGARVTRERKDAHQSGVAGPAIITESYNEVASETWTAFTPKVAIDWQFDDEMLFYASIAKGFKSGGFQGQAPSNSAASRAFDPETVIDYELGLKSEWWQRRLRLNVALFYMDYRDLQVLQLVDVPVEEGGILDDETLSVLVTENAADAVSQGLEVEWLYRQAVQEGWELSGSYAYLDATYKNFAQQLMLADPSTGEEVLVVNDLSGKRLRNAPEHSFNFALAYHFLWRSGASVNVRWETRYKGRTFQDTSNLLAASVPSYSLHNLRAAYTSPSQPWDLEAWVQNITDKDYIVHNYPVPQDASTATPATPGAPRTFGLTFHWNYE